ncbi:sugar transferase [Gemmobacter sp. 24YEA27]|uniref:sugar transferase n=1 Tax=Gemmobacter sp. 24YEA27 TaxID=3040672 RepID=UPI0024B33414|nr:sugar transferase [Gemmobacter sp. 24YEA27]
MRVDIHQDNAKVFVVSEVIPPRRIEEVAAKKERLYSRIGKPVLDRIFAFFALIFFAPFFFIIAVSILVSDRGPVLFRHKRIGKDGRPFYCLKFRTMASDAETRLRHILENDPLARAEWDASHKLTHDPRITCLGAFFRKTSLDELPQFWNVLRGEMSVVGPRPIVEAEMHHYGDDITSYLAVLPGITGLWQVSGVVIRPIWNGWRWMSITPAGATCCWISGLF